MLVVARPEPRPSNVVVKVIGHPYLCFFSRLSTKEHASRDGANCNTPSLDGSHKGGNGFSARWSAISFSRMLDKNSPLIKRAVVGE
jgi:hypothetical protein